MTGAEQHITPHHLAGVCICPCDQCTHHQGRSGPTCICPTCPADRCGLKATR